MIERVDRCPGGVAATTPMTPRVAVTTLPAEFELARAIARARFGAALNACDNPWYCATHGKEVRAAHGGLLAFERVNAGPWVEEARAAMQALPRP